MVRSSIISVHVISVFFFTAGNLHAQAPRNVYELRKLTDEDWLEMTTEERLKALNISNNHARNQTFFGDFGRNYDLYRRWGYDYYEMEDRYENYSFRGFDNYRVLEDRRNKWEYGEFGDRITQMTHVGQIWRERFNDDGTTNIDENDNPIAQEPSGYLNFSDEYLRDRTTGIWVVSESTKDWAVSAIGANSLRTKLTPLTLSIPDLGGMRIDFQSANYEASFVNSVLEREKPVSTWRKSFNTLMLRAFQFRRKFGVLTLGTTYANMYAMQNNREKGDSLEGTVSDFALTPLIYYIRIRDDSPNDAGGPVIHDVKLKVDGVYRPDIIPMIIMDNLKKDKVSAVIRDPNQAYLLRYYSDYVPPYMPFEQDFPYNYSEIPKFVDYMYMRDYMNGWNTSSLTKDFDIDRGKEYYKIIDQVKPLQVNETEFAVYIFDITSIQKKVKRVSAEITIENDYKIEVSEINAENPKGRQDPRGDWYENYYKPTYWKIMAQADGNIKDGSNFHTLTVDFAYEVANLIYGLDAHYDYNGVKVNAEYVVNTHHYMFSDGVPGEGLPRITNARELTQREGHRSTITDNAYYVTFQKDWQRFGIAGEFFKMGKFYRPSMSYTRLNKVSTQGGIVDKVETGTYTLIADNDDNDHWSGIDYLVGNDLDKDFVQDNDKNSNRIPDYAEPFWMFDVDPDDYVFGDDINNNTVPDFREDDIKYDTPYDLDRKGHHFYLRYTPREHVNLMAGSIKTRGIGLDIRTDDDYFKLYMDYDVFDIGNLYGEYRYDRIQDNIQDRATVYAGDFTRRFEDEVEYRNSRVNKLFLESRIRAVPSLTLENHVKYERNKQIGGTMYDNTFQFGDIVTTYAIVNKFAYTRQMGNWTFSSGIKFRLYKKDFSRFLYPRDHEYWRIPLINLKYSVSPDTNITFGIQGYKGMYLYFKDYIRSQNNYNQSNIMFQLYNTTRYYGFDIVGICGFRLEERMFVEANRKFENYKTSSLFVKIVAGY